MSGFWSELASIEALASLPWSATWKPIASFTGVESNETDTFTIDADVWRVWWFAQANETNAELELAFFAIHLYEVNETAYSLGITCYPDAFAFLNPQGNRAYLVGTGIYYCDVIAANLEEWMIIIEVYE